MRYFVRAFRSIEDALRALQHCHGAIIAVLDLKERVSPAEWGEYQDIVTRAWILADSLHDMIDVIWETVVDGSKK